MLGAICITTEYRNKTITSTLVLIPRRSRVLAAKVVVVAWWCILMAVLSLVVVVAAGLPWNAALGGVTSTVTGQLGAVVPGLVVATILFGWFGLGFGTLVKNQVAGILLTIGFTFILEPILVLLSRGIFHYDLNWLPSSAAGITGRVTGPRWSRRQPRCDDALSGLVGRWPRHAGLGPGAVGPRFTSPPSARDVS